MPYELLTVDGVMRIDSETYSIALRVDDVNYQGARPEDQYRVREAWAAYLDSLDHTVRLGIFIMNKRVSPEEFASDLLFREVPGDDRGNVLRREYNAWTHSMLAKSSRSVRRDRIVTIAVSADTMERASRAFHKRPIPSCASCATSDPTRISSTASSVSISSKP